MCLADDKNNLDHAVVLVYQVNHTKSYPNGEEYNVVYDN